MIAANLRRYKNIEFIQYLSQVIETVSKQDIDALLLTEPFNEVNLLVTKLKGAYKQTQGSSVTPEIQELDNKRDKAIRGFRMLVNAYTTFENDAIAIAATKLLGVIDKHGTNIARRNYNEQTGIIDTIIKDIANSVELTETVVSLNATEWIGNLNKTNLDFNNKYLERIDELVARDNIDFLELRTDAIKAYKNLVDHISAHTILSENEAYSVLSEKIDSLSEYYNRVVDNRSNVSVNDDTSDTTNEENTLVDNA
ncbi:DUF6261 family protein [Tenacibaculum sp. M341]|uniref:DUF6261 family protein n=1 Tax=Tenacibaculum sp. M341 TaxID=2530339 RepID=UPI00104988EC|nr:DUF6261 family protein [Tenacibaculum sp. M341]TCI95086.1 hypothetical protein EYW44_01820 [Tenacibaculum sp. M341]